MAAENGVGEACFKNGRFWHDPKFGCADKTPVRCGYSNGRFGVNLNLNSKAPDGLHRALLSQVTRLLGSEDVEIVDVCQHTVVPSARDQFWSLFIQETGDLSGKVRFAASVVGKDVEDSEVVFVNL